MKKIICLLVLLSIPATVARGEVIRTAKLNPDWSTELIYYSNGKEIARERIDYTGDILNSTGKIPDGIVKAYSEAGKLLLEMEYKDGKPEGIIKRYNEEGKLILEETRKDGKLEGIKKEYYDNGQLKFEALYKNNKIDGVYKEYYPDGKLWIDKRLKDGKPDGIQRSYNNNGDLIMEEDYNNGIVQTNKLFYKNGAIKTIVAFKDGKPVSEIKYDENGNLLNK